MAGRDDGDSGGHHVGDLYAVLLSTATLGAIGLLGVWVGQAWLFPSLGSTVFLQTMTPHEPSSQLWNTVAGHAIGIAAGVGATLLLGAQHAPPVLGSDTLTTVRVAATALAVGATVALQLARHPPAAATTMLITLGALKPAPHTLMLVVAGVALVAALGELVRRLHPDRRRGA